MALAPHLNGGLQEFSPPANQMIEWGGKKHKYMDEGGFAARGKEEKGELLVPVQPSGYFHHYTGDPEDKLATRRFLTLIPDILY